MMDKWIRINKKKSFSRNAMLQFVTMSSIQLSIVLKQHRGLFVKEDRY